MPGRHAERRLPLAPGDRRSLPAPPSYTGFPAGLVCFHSGGLGSSPTPGSPAGQPGWGGTVREGLSSLNEKPFDELLKEIKGVKGVGNYAAENLMKLLN